ncbi:MAG: SEC-C domain-containing protein [Sphingobacteriaceae bacterium]|nr:SEC-C domain-containing protein [Sphingobacteriaceae bacterium]
MKMRTKSYKLIHETRKIDRILEDGQKVFNNKGRNEKCPCGSGKKFKRCCHNKLRNPIKD